jgi:hypothetical protein
MMKLILTLAPIVMLLILGFLIVLRSGMENARGWDRGRKLAVSNISRLLISLFGLATSLVVLHRLIGNPILVAW